LNNNERVIIVGAGPVGLSAACVLAGQGVPVTVLEAEPALPENLRASTFHPATLDLLSRFGASDRLIEMGIKAPTLQYRERTGWYVHFDFAQISDLTRYPFRVQCEQFKLNGVLLEWLRQNAPDVDVRFSSKVVGLRQTEHEVTALIESAQGREEVQGQYLIGADGARSAVREAIGITLEGFTWPERFLVVSTPADFSHDFENLAPVSYFTDPEAWFFLLKVGRLWRVMFPTDTADSDASVLAEEAIQARLQRVAPRSTPYEIVHRTLYGVHQRVSPSYRKGRVFLAGDAAHINNPLGGMGMNGGIHDAFNLAEKMARVWRGEADDSELDRYERQRRPIAIEYVDRITIQNKKDLEIKDPAERAAYRQRMEETARDPEKSRQFLMRISMIASLQKAAQLG
jgi:3-(3-hydroxy-phenyl)propionate hydroxylase